MSELCTDNRFEIIAKAKADLIESTNIETSEDEMACLDSFLLRCWQMGWLRRYEDTISDSDEKLRMAVEAIQKSPLVILPSTELTQDEAYAVAEFIDCNIFDAIREDDDWDSFQALRNLIHAYEKCCAVSGFIGLSDNVVEERR